MLHAGRKSLETNSAGGTSQKWRAAFATATEPEGRGQQGDQPSDKPSPDTSIRAAQKTFFICAHERGRPLTPGRAKKTRGAFSLFLYCLTQRLLAFRLKPEGRLVSEMSGAAFGSWRQWCACAAQARPVHFQPRKESRLSPRIFPARVLVDQGVVCSPNGRDDGGPLNRSQRQQRPF